MGGCVSARRGQGRNGGRRSKRSLREHVTALQHLPYVPNRIFTNGKSRTSCIFTQQGRKGINQDAMVVWEVSSILCFKTSFWFIDFGLLL